MYMHIYIYIPLYVYAYMCVYVYKYIYALKANIFSFLHIFNSMETCFRPCYKRHTAGRGINIRMYVCMYA